MTLHSDLEKLAELLKTNPSITVLTGAGVSAASGIPTFRDAGGLWKDFRPEEVATPEAFARDPKFVWEWYDYRRNNLLECGPNRGHEVLAAWSRRYPGFQLFTQNVDGLHEKAGTEHVVRYHGSIWEVGCWEGCPDSPPRWRDETVPFEALPPPCPYCGGILRPGVVWYGEMIDTEVLTASLEATNCEVFFAIGTSAVVYPAASMVEAAKQRGAYTVEINPEATPAAAYLDLPLTGKSEEVLDRLERLLTLAAGP